MKFIHLDILPQYVILVSSGSTLSSKITSRMRPRKHKQKILIKKNSSTYLYFFFRIENANVEHIMCSECVTRCRILPKRDKSRIFSLYFWKYWRRNCSISDWWDFVLFFTTSLWNNRQNQSMCLSSFSPVISKKNFRNKISSWMDLAKSCSVGFLRLDTLWNFLCQRLWKKWIWRN